MKQNLILICSGANGIDSIDVIKFSNKEEFNKVILAMLNSKFSDGFPINDNSSENSIYLELSKFLDSAKISGLDEYEFTLLDLDFKPIKAQKIDFNNGLVNINITTRNPSKWFLVDTESGVVYNHEKREATTTEYNAIKRVCVEATEL